MSQRKSKTGVPHLVYQANTGFQYYLTFPKHFALSPKLPLQIRWSLGHDEGLARALTTHLNTRFKSLIAKTDEFRVQHLPELVVFELSDCHLTTQDALRGARRFWRDLPTPQALAAHDLATASERLASESQKRPVLFTDTTGGEIHFALVPSPALLEVLGVSFSRFDWPLGTRDPAAAQDAAVYIFAALEILEKLPATRHRSSRNVPTFTLMSLYEYLCFARPDRGRNLVHLPAVLPQSAEATPLFLRQNPDPEWRFAKCESVNLVQAPNGLYSLDIPLPDEIQKRFKCQAVLRIELLTSSPIVAALLVRYCAQRIDKMLTYHFIYNLETTSFEQALDRINALIRGSLGALPPAGPMHPLPELSQEASVTALSDPGTQALLNALSSVLSDTQKTRLNALFDVPAQNERIVHLSQTDGSMRLSALVTDYEERQIREGAWANPRTRITAHARLEGLSELLGGHRRIDSLTRAEFNALRDQLRCYPKNRHRLRATRYQPLAKIIQDGKYEPINARTAKKFFELARALINFAYDQGYLQENIAAGLTFSTKGAVSPRKRTYSPGQIEKLLVGPVFTLQYPPRWRLDDYKFWLPLLGLYTGARLSELCQLRLEDIRQESGVWVMSINQGRAKQLKTVDSERLVPLHAAVLGAGFLEFHTDRLHATQHDSSALLFDTIRVYRDLAPGHIASRWYLGSGQGRAGYLGLCGLGEDGLTFHGLRHTFINQFRRQKLDMLIGKALVGHVDKTTTGGYGDCYPARVLKTEIDKIDFEVPLAHIHYQNYKRLQDLQGPFKTGRPVGSLPAGGGASAKRHWSSYVPS